MVRQSDAVERMAEIEKELSEDLNPEMDLKDKKPYYLEINFKRWTFKERPF